MKDKVPHKVDKTKSNSQTKKKPIYIVLHVGRVQVGELIGRATAPVKVSLVTFLNTLSPKNPDVNSPNLP